MTRNRCKPAGIVVSLISAVLAVFLAGCGGGTEAGTVELNGTVTVDGKPVGQAAVAFLGNNGARLASAQTDAAGKFTIVAALGENAVTVSKGSAEPVVAPLSDEDMLMPTDQEYQAIQKEQAESEVPAKYADPKTSGLKINVVEGMQNVDLALSSK